MESWSYISGDKGSISDATISASGCFTTNRNAFMNLGLKGSFSFSNNLIVSGQETAESHGFGEFGYGELIGRQLTNGSVVDVTSSKVIEGRTDNPIMATLNSFSLDGESSNSKLSSSVIDSNSRDSSLIDLKLGRFPDYRDGQSSNFSTGAPILSSYESSTLPKRVRAARANCQTAYCQVFGCNKNLTSSKDYHKRHKVCEVHSKTSKVIVNGIEQRFCQQCSRFHLLAEFDDGKRSCRKRLAGHNERRRKPQVGIQSGGNGKLHQQYNGFAGGSFHGTMLTTGSFICQDILSSGLLHPDKYVTNEWGKRVKVEDGTDCSHLFAVPVDNWHFDLKSPHHRNGMEKIFPSLHHNGANAATGGNLVEKNGQYPHDFGGTSSGSHHFFPNSMFGSDNIDVFDAASNVQGSYGFSETVCAHSLLSSQSQNSSTHSSGVPMACSLTIPGNHNHYTMSQVSEKLVGAPNKFSSSGINSTEATHLGAQLISDGSEAANFDISDGLSHDDGPTINLLQLSSQLQRVEHQRQSMQVKHVSETFCLRIV